MTAIARAIDALHAATAIYTREPVVRDLIERTGWPHSGGRFFDPSAGDGAFLVTAIELLKPAPADFSSLERVSGWELHPTAVAQARGRISAALEELGWNREDAAVGADAVVKLRDFITDDLAEIGKVRVVAGNPPYLRFSRLPDHFKTVYGSSLPKSARGDLQHAFLHRCSAIREDAGCIAFVTADRWLGNQTASNLRADLGESLGIGHIRRLDVETSFYRPKNRIKGSLPRIHPVSVILTDRSASGSFPLTSEPVSPDGYDQPAWDGERLTDIATVRIAPWLGPKGVFVLPNERLPEFAGVPTLPVIDSDNLDIANRSLRPSTHFVLNTDRKREPEGLVRSHILEQFERLPARCKGGRWWHPPEAITLDLDRPALVVPRIAKRLAPIRVPAGILPSEHSIYVIGDLEGADLDRLERILLSDAAHEWMIRNAPRLEDGYFDIRSNLIRRIPAFF